MAVYLDPPRDWGWRLGPSCHLIADTEDELHRFAALIGLKRSWFQARSFPHYDLTIARRCRAVQLGAVELDRRSFVRELRRIRGENAQAKKS